MRILHQTPLQDGFPLHLASPADILHHGDCCTIVVPENDAGEALCRSRERELLIDGAGSLVPRLDQGAAAVGQHREAQRVAHGDAAGWRARPLQVRRSGPGPALFHRSIQLG